MILRCVCWSIFLCLAFRPAVNAQVQVDEHGYQNVLISFAPNVPSEKGRELVKTVEELLQNTSNVLQTAIGIRIASVTFLLPPSWTTETWEGVTISPASSDLEERTPDIRLDATAENPFGKQPVTLQHGGCGVPGHQITLPLDFLSSSEDYPRGKLLAREWLKYRYGVFDENGFTRDELYPDYYRIPGSSDIRITECTNSPVNYTFKNPSNDEECTVMGDGVEFDLCRLHPVEESAANVTSSLMYFHQELQNMEHVCGKGDHPHHSTTLSKQNILCNGQSIWDVIEVSKDFNITQQEPTEVPETIQFSYVHSKSKFVVLLEDSDHLIDLVIPIRLALKRFYYDLPPKNKLAIIKFTNKAVDVLSYKQIPAQERDDLGTIAALDALPNEVCTSCALLKATEILKQDTEVGGGSIILITASTLDSLTALPEDVKDSGFSLRVVRFTGEANPSDTSYEVLKESFSQLEYDEIAASSEQLSVFETLSSSLTKSVPQSKDFESKTILTGMMSGPNPLTIPQDAKASLYTLWLGNAFEVDSIKCKAGDADVELKAGTKATEISSFTFEPKESEITCGFASPKQKEFLAQVQMTTKQMSFDIWIHNESTDTEQLPIIIYAKISFDGYPVKEANAVAVVTTENKPEEIVKLLDNGRGDPDTTQYDGVYSGYFAGFDSAGDYVITVKIDDNQGQAKIGKEDPELMSPTCCGSKIASKDGDVPAFQVEKSTKYVAKNKKPEDGYQPSRIVDLRVGVYNASNFALLTWTAPGGGKASSYEFYALCDLEDCEDGRLPKWLTLNRTEPKPRSYGEPEEVAILFSPDIPKIENLTLFFAIRSANEKGKLSDLSNKAEIFLSLMEPPTTTPFTTIETTTSDGRKLAQSEKAGIIVGSIIIGILLLLCIGALLYFCVIKPRRAKPSNIDHSGYFQDKNQNGSEVSGSFRSIPTRDRGSMRRVESFPVLLYTHDQLKDFKKKVDPPLYKPAIAPRPWMSMNVLSNDEPNRSGDSKSVGSASTLPMNDKHRSTEMEQLDDVSLASGKHQPEETIKV